MSSFDVSASCGGLELDIELDDLAIIFPGGAVLEIPVPPGIDVAFAIDYAKQILAAVSAALMPLQPIFSVIETLSAIMDFCTAVPDAITGLDPGLLIEAIPKIAKPLAKLLAMIPPLSIPIFIHSLIKVILVMLKGIRFALNAIIDAVVVAASADARAEVVAEISLEVSISLKAAAECAKANAKVSMQGLSQGLKPLDTLLKILKSLIDLIGIPVEMPTVASLGEDAKVGIEILDALILALGLVVKAIPI